VKFLPIIESLTWNTVAFARTWTAEFASLFTSRYMKWMKWMQFRFNIISEMSDFAQRMNVWIDLIDYLQCISFQYKVKQTWIFCKYNSMQSGPCLCNKWIGMNSMSEAVSCHYSTLKITGNNSSINAPIFQINGSISINFINTCWWSLPQD
jgi:hypothetical protein